DELTGLLRAPYGLLLPALTHTRLFLDSAPLRVAELHGGVDELVGVGEDRLLRLGNSQVFGRISGTGDQRHRHHQQRRNRSDRHAQKLKPILSRTSCLVFSIRCRSVSVWPGYISPPPLICGSQVSVAHHFCPP